MKVAAPSKLISAHTLSKAALASQTAHARSPPPDVCVQQIGAHWTSSHCHWILFQQSPLLLSDGNVPPIELNLWPPGCLLRFAKHMTALITSTARSEPPHFHLQLTFIVRGFPWAFPFLSFQIDFSFFFKYKGNCLLPLSANNPLWATEYPRLSVAIVGVLQILLSWLKQIYIKIRNLAYTCKKGIFNHRYILKS